jgi:hypothetical protein
VNRPTDEDLQMIEAYLDDELTVDEVDALRERLIEEPSMSAALATLREGREARAAAFTSMEPGEVAVSETVGAVMTSTRARARWDRRWREGLRYVAAAACVTIGVMVGSRATRVPQQQFQSLADVTPVSDRMTPTGAPGMAPPGLFDETRPPQPVQFTGSTINPIRPAGTARTVILADGRGKFVVQEFATAEEARQFVEDLRRSLEGTGHTIVPAVPSPLNRSAPAPTFASSPEPPSRSDARVVPVADEQF